MSEKCADCGIPKVEVIKRNGEHADVCQNEGRQNINWGLATVKFNRHGEMYAYRYIGNADG
jgi:hypothetical protein